MVPLRKSVPYEQPKEQRDTAEVFRLDPALVEWAYQLTKDVPLIETDQMKQERSTPPAQGCACVSASTDADAPVTLVSKNAYR